MADRLHCFLEYTFANVLCEWLVVIPVLARFFSVSCFNFFSCITVLKMELILFCPDFLYVTLLLTLLFVLI